MTVIEWKPKDEEEALHLCQEIYDNLADSEVREVFIRDDKTGILEVNPVLKIKQPLIKVMWALECLSASGDILIIKDFTVMLTNMQFDLICNGANMRRKWIDEAE